MILRDIRESDSLARNWFIARLKKYRGKGKGKIFDFGSGARASFGTTLAQMGFDVYCNDILPFKPRRKERVVLRTKKTKFSFHYIRGDITDTPVEMLQVQEPFDFIVNLSSIEHAGLTGRYESKDDPDQDLKIMKILQKIIKPDGIHLLQIPIGIDDIIGYYHRIYGEKRLPRLLEGWQIEEEDYWKKENDGKNLYQLTYREDCLKERATKIAPRYYAFGCFQLKVTK